MAPPFLFSRFEARTVDLNELALEMNSASWQDLTRLQQVLLLKKAVKPPRGLIDPASIYMKYWDTVVVMALLFTALVTPFEVAILQENGIDALFVVNQVVNLIFIKDMCFQFFLKTQIRTDNGLVWVRDRRRIAKIYLKGWFVLDLLSVLPFDMIAVAVDSPGIRRMKMIRIIRLLRLLKLFRMLKALKIIVRWQDQMAVPYSTLEIVKLGCGMVCVSHWLACSWTLVGLYLALSGVPDDKDWCENGVWQWSRDYGDGGISWVTMLYGEGGKDSPDTPCSPWNLYFAALYFSVMTITSIGYGDIVPQRTAEYAVCTILMLFGGVMWAYILGSFCNVVSNLNPYQTEFRRFMDKLNYMLKDHQVNKELQGRCRAYIREAGHLARLKHYNLVAESMSPQLQHELLCEIRERTIRGIWFFKDCSPRFAAELARNLQPQMYETREEIHRPDHLMVVERGSVSSGGKLIVRGQALGLDFILSNRDLRHDPLTYALTYTEVVSLSHDQLFNILEAEPIAFAVEYRRIRKAVARLAMRRGILLSVKERLRDDRINAPQSDRLCPQKMARAEAVQRIRDSWHNFDGRSGSDGSHGSKALATRSVALWSPSQPLPLKLHHPPALSAGSGSFEESPYSVVSHEPPRPAEHRWADAGGDAHGWLIQEIRRAVREEMRDYLATSTTFGV